MIERHRSQRRGARLPPPPRLRHGLFQPALLAAELRPQLAHRREYRPESPVAPRPIRPLRQRDQPLVVLRPLRRPPCASRRPAERRALWHAPGPFEPHPLLREIAQPHRFPLIGAAVRSHSRREPEHLDAAACRDVHAVATRALAPLPHA